MNGNDFVLNKDKVGYVSYYVFNIQLKIYTGIIKNMLLVTY